MSSIVFNITEDPDMLDKIPVNNLTEVSGHELEHVLGTHFPCLSGAKVMGLTRSAIENLFPQTKTHKNIFVESDNGGVLRIWKYCYGDSCKSLRERLGIK